MQAINDASDYDDKVLQLKTDELRFQTLEEFVQAPKTLSQIRGIDPGEAIVVVFGPPKGGKTFSICDLTMSAAHGLSEWHGHKISGKLKVAYLAGEGVNGLKVRLHGWLAHHDNITERGDFVVLPRALSLPARADDVIAALRASRPKILVTDTLNAFFGSANENDTSDMTAFVAAIRRIRDELGCSIYVIHHSGLADQSRERGSIVLRGAADVVIQIAKDSNGSGLVGFQVIDGRDIEPMEEPLSLKLHRVETDWLDEDGEALMTCIVNAGGSTVALPGRCARPMGDAQSQLLGVLQRMAAERQPDEKGDVLLARHEVSAQAQKEGLDRRRVSQSWQSLANRQLIRLLEPGSVAVRQGSPR